MPNQMQPEMRNNTCPQISQAIPNGRENSQSAMLSGHFRCLKIVDLANELNEI
jgi:hypothetical protein